MRAPPRVLVLGGTGRVGGATLRALARTYPGAMELVVAGRNGVRGRRVADALGECAEFVELDIGDASALKRVVEGCDVVVHAAGPFQRRAAPGEVLKAAIGAGVAYVDICDDLGHATVCRALAEEAVAAGVPALVCTGIYPGLSNLMVAEAVDRLQGARAEVVRIAYHTAGTGGIGATVLASTFLILSERAVVFDADGRRVTRPPASDPEVVDFGGRIGKKTAYLLNLPEVTSLHECLLERTGGGVVEAKFSTDPPIWNWLLQAMAKWTPTNWLANRPAMQAFAAFSLPVVRAVDFISGALTGIKVVVSGAANADGERETVTFSYEHESLEACVGEATAAFVIEMLRQLDADVDGTIRPGVHYPEELDADVRARICANATLTANAYSAVDGSRRNRASQEAN